MFSRAAEACTGTSLKDGLEEELALQCIDAEPAASLQSGKTSV